MCSYLDMEKFLFWIDRTAVAEPQGPCPSGRMTTPRSDSPPQRPASPARSSAPGRLPTRPNSVYEWQLFALLQRANLLQYYDTFIAVGGDDVQQLLEAREDEFLEIMALVGMHSKPLHVRRLQKALQEYSSNPARFHMLALQRHAAPMADQISLLSQSPMYPAGAQSAESPGPSPQPNGGGGSSGIWPSTPSMTAIVGPGAYLSDFDLVAESSMHPGSATSPSLTDGQLKRIVECAGELARTLPEYEPKMVQNKKKIGRDLLEVMNMLPDNENRVDRFRQYAAIYGRFDAKRKADKALTLHEVSVNEAAAQICLWRPALLTRRDELFPLARQVVRDAGYNYVKGPTKGKGNSSDTEEHLGDLSSRKRSTPDESVASSRSHTPSSSMAGTPPVSGSSSGPVNEPSTSDGPKRPRFSEEFFSLDVSVKQQRLHAVTEEINSLDSKQKQLKEKVETAHDIGELTSIQREMQGLSQKQMELSNLHAALSHSLGDFAKTSEWSADELQVKSEPPEEEEEEKGQ